MRLMHRAAGTVRMLVHSAVITLILPRRGWVSGGARGRTCLRCSSQDEMTTGPHPHKAYSGTQRNTNSDVVCSKVRPYSVPQHALRRRGAAGRSAGSRWPYGQTSYSQTSY
ncbi:hypothetical protein F5883DRAFT_556689, partial [Diaporthe sp. PMI_573]